MKPVAGNARLAAIRAVGQVLDQHRTLDECFAGADGLESRDRAFARRLSYGMLRWLSALEWISGRLLDKPLRRRDRDVGRLVLLGIYQLWKEDTPEHAAIHATADCARLIGKGWATALVNAVLRRFQRERETLLKALSKVPERHAHPLWLLESLRSDWPEQWEGIVSANNSPGDLWLRVNRERAEIARLTGELEEKGFAVANHPEAPDALAISPAVGVERIPGFAEGLVSVQDPAAQLAAGYLGLQPGQRVLDACAAPGGKTCHLLERQPDIALLALDRDPERVGMIRDNLRRLGLSCETRVADAGEPDDWWDGQPFDRILLDAPCSATGIIRRHPDIKWLRDAVQVENAVAAQERLLDRLWPLLVAGGILVYATCSVLKSENHQQIHGFLDRHPEAEPGMPERPDDPGAGPGRQILPGETGMDGFYYAVLRKPA